MKYIATVAAAATLSGCAGLQSEPPHYNYAEQALIAPGFPVERVDKPAGYRFVKIEDGRERQEYTQASDQGSTLESVKVVAWNTAHGNTAVMTAGVVWLTGDSHYLPWNDSDGYEFIGRDRVQYKYTQGRYQDVVPDVSLMPEGVPDCAYSITMVSRNVRKKFVGTYTQGVTCYDMPLLTSYHREQQREEAFELFGLK